MRGILVVFVMALCEIGAAQSPTPKPSPALDSLVSTAKEVAQEKKSFQTILDQARSIIDSSAKQLSDQLSLKNKELLEELKKDKKFGPKLAELETIQKQMSSLSDGQNKKFQAETGPIQQKISVDNAVVGGFVPVVRKENGWSDDTIFDVETQTWKKPEPKKE